MFIFCVVQDETRDGKRQVRYRVGIGIDKYNLAVCDSTAEQFVGRKFSPRFEWIFRSLKEDFSGIDLEQARCILRDALKHIFEWELSDDVTLAQLDKKFHPGRCAEDSSGELQLYQKLKEKYGTRRGKGESKLDVDDDKATVILYKGV